MHDRDNGRITRRNDRTRERRDRKARASDHRGRVAPMIREPHRTATPFRRYPITVFLAAVLPPLICGANAAAGETLYNGIILPDEWPPKIEKLTHELMPVPYLDNRPEIVPIDIGRQLFVDDFLIEKTTLKRTYHQATLHPTNPVLKPDANRRWEVSTNDKPCAMVFSDGVWFDPSDNLFKMWYMGGYTRSVCYATSKDGISWDKPSLDIVRGTNIVLDGSRDSSLIWRDQQAADPEHRYKMLIVTQCRDGRNGVDMVIRYSPDGIRWSPPVAERWHGGDRSTFFHNPFREKWVYSFRHDSKETGRSRMYLECTDLAEGFRRMDELVRLWTCADRLDPRNPDPRLHNITPQLYNLDAVAYESLVLGLFAVWQGDPAGDLKIRKEKRNELLIGFSRDGFYWHRPDRRPFVGVNESPGAWNWGNIQSAGGCCLVVGDELYFYVSGRGEDRSHGACTTGLAVLRRDGFASMDAGDETGTVTTRPIVFKGKYLFVNANAAGGELRVEVLDREGKPLPRMGRNRCLPITTDGTIQPVRWLEDADLGSVAGTPVRLRFHLTKGKLYSFWVSLDQSGASNGYVAAGGPGFTRPTDTAGMAAYKAAAVCSPVITTRPADHVVGRWECLLHHAPFEPRDTAENAVFRDKMWLSNGWLPTPGAKEEAINKRDLWNSTDGIHWSLISDNTPYDVYSEMATFDNRLWAVKESVWSSPDGIMWNKVLDKVPFGARGYGELVVFKDRMWQLGSGQDVWSTADGANWTCATAHAPYGNRACTAVAAYDGKLWLMAGRVEKTNDPPEKGYKQYTTFNDVWCSTDGAHWECVLERAPWPPRMWAVAEGYAGRLWLIGGYSNAERHNLADVWWTRDGKNWTRFESTPHFAPRHEVTPYVFDGSLWVVAGNTWPVVNDVWRLTLPTDAGHVNGAGDP